MALPPDLRVLCRRLAATNPNDLPRLTPILVSELLPCGAVLSAPHEARTKDTSSDVTVHIHKLKTQINSLLNGKSYNGRFAAVVLIKALVDVGGWECLRLSEPWVRGLLSIIQRPGPTATKELSIVAVTRIYSLLHGYQTLVREIATPTLPSFVNACLQLIKPPASGQPLRLPPSLVETVVSALGTIIPLYPTTLRPFAAQIRTAIRGYIAPTSSDDGLVSESLKQASRRLLVSMHYTAPKNGSSEEWVKATESFLRDCHTTADQVFRAVHGSWESTAGYTPGNISYDGEPTGGGSTTEELPTWTGLLSGAERLSGLMELLADCFRCPTKTPVAIPLGSLMDLVSRISSVVPPGPGREDRTQLNAAIGREEKDELWSALPGIHTAAVNLLSAVVSRLGRSLLPLSRDMIDHTIRMFKAVGHIPSSREATYLLIKDLLSLTGPTLDKLAVDSLAPLIQAVCRDLLQSAGHLPSPAPPTSPQPPNGAKKHHHQTAGNADAFLDPKAKSTTSTTHFPPSHLHSASALLPSLLSHLPQAHLPPDSRGLIDRTAILSRNKSALLASVLHPFRDSNGRYYPSILPFLARQFPHSQEVEVLRCNLRAPKGGDAAREVWEPLGGLEELLGRSEREEEVVPGRGFGGLDWGEKAGGDGLEEEVRIEPFVPLGGMEIDRDVVVGSFAGGKTAPVVAEEIVVAVSAEQDVVAPMSPLKRKGESLDSGKAKKVGPQPVKRDEDEDEGGSESDEGDSIQIDMTMDDDEEEEEEEDQ